MDMDPIPGTSWMTEEEAATRESIRLENERKRKAEERKAKDRERKRLRRSQETEDQRQRRQSLDNERHQNQRSNEDEFERQRRQRIDNERHESQRTNETEDERQHRQWMDNERHRRQRETETEGNREERQRLNAESHRNRYSQMTDGMREMYISQVQERSQNVRAQSRHIGRRREMPRRHDTGPMEHVCQHCGAKFWLEEKAKGSRSNPEYKKCCDYGNIMLPSLREMPELLKTLFEGSDSRSREFRNHIRAYNTLLSFTSCGAKIDENIMNDRNGIFTYRIHGEMYHRMGSLLPTTNEPKFLQIYFYDTDNEANNRLKEMPNRNRNLIESLTQMLRQINPYISHFKSAIESIQLNQATDIKFAIKAEGRDPRTYNLPTSSDIAAIIPGDNNGNMRDIIIEGRSDGLKRISEIHRSYDSCNYVLLFPSGEFGYSLDMRKTNGKKMTQCDYYGYRLHYREGNLTIHRGGRLLLQFVVDVWARIEQSRLQYIRFNQKQLRAEVYNNLVDAVNDFNIELEDIGRATILPSSFYGSPRFMIENYQDAMAMVRKYGKPDVFATFTCNPKWPEITRELLPHQSANDRPDLIARVFHMKLKAFLEDLIKSGIFGRVIAYCYTIEFQKRGLPHCHILLILDALDKIRNPEDIDEIVSAMIPDQEEFPLAYETVTKNMIHGPCGHLNPTSPCMKDGKCTKGYPKEFREQTSMPSDGYPEYKRPDNGVKITVERDNKRIEVDNRFVVPHNLFLTTKYNAHINVEVCNTVKSVKYIYKYINKGSDKANIEVSKDEIKTYLDARYISSCESIWRTLEFSLHDNKPAVYRLEVHLPNQQMVTFDANQDRENIINNTKRTKLMAWFDYNSNNSDGRHLLYIDFPEHYTFANMEWKKRKRNLERNTIGRMYLVMPKEEERYYLRLLLTHIRGATSFEEMKTINGIQHHSFKEAAKALGLLEDDNEWDRLMEEAETHHSSKQLRILFTSILMHCRPTEPRHLWDKYFDAMTEDIVRNVTGENLRLSEVTTDAVKELITKHTITDIDDILISLGSSLNDFPTLPQLTTRETEINRLIADEMQDIDQVQLTNKIQHLNQDQKRIFDDVIACVENNISRHFFVDGPGGTGKTFLYNTILSAVRSQRRIAIAMASSGLAALLLDNGRTAHSRFKIPIKVNETSSCFISANSDLAKLMRRTDLFIWDEAPMMNKYVFEAVNRTMKDITKVDRPFGGKVFIFGGDFRQILPVVKNGSDYDIINSCLKRSTLWKDIKVRRLTINMRLTNQEDQRQKEFAEYLLRIGDNREPNIERIITLPDNLCRDISLFEEFIQDIIPLVNDWTILCPKNDTVDNINLMISRRVEGETREYLSADKVDTSENPQHEHLYPPEYLNSLNLSGIPPHRLTLKIGSPIMLLRNINPKFGLCNGTQLRCRSFEDHMIEAEVITGTHKGDVVFLHRMTMQPSDNLLPFTFTRRQFPIRPSYAMSINKAQGQTFNRVAIYLENDVFTHGQLYVAMSRVTSYENLIIFTRRNSDNQFVTKNIVFKI